MVTHADFVAAVRSLIGTPVVHLGRQPGKALDCVGVPWAAAVQLGLDLPPTPMDYPPVPRAQQLHNGLSLFCDRVDGPDGAHLWQVFCGRDARHVVVPVGQNEAGQILVVHADPKRSRQHGTVVRLSIAPALVHAYWRIRGVA